MKKFWLVGLVLLISILSTALVAEDGRGKNDRDGQKNENYRKDNDRNNDSKDHDKNPWDFSKTKSERNEHYGRDRNDHRNHHDHQHYYRNGIYIDVDIGGIDVEVVRHERGYWADRVVGYEYVEREVYHPAKVSYVWNWSEMSYEKHITPAWTEIVSCRVPITKRVWVSY